MNNNGRKISSKYLPILIFTVLFFSVTFNSPANYSPRVRFDKTLTSAAAADTVRPLPHIDTSYRDISGDTARYATIRLRYGRRIDTPDYRISKDTLAAEISYKASDSIVMKVHSHQITLFSNAEAKYSDADLTADRITFDQDRNIVVAGPTRDSAGNIVGLPKMVQGDNTMHSDSIVYNIKTQKGITEHTSTVSGEMFVHAEKLKKITPEEYFGYRGVFTTCSLDTPHFAFRTNKMKIINQKMAITGPIHPEFEGVPIPIYIPFGFFPLTTGRHSGLLPPEFTSSDQAGLGLTGLGYYKVLNDYFDVIFRTDLYSYGGWAAYLTPTYKVRYKYSGQVNLTLQYTKYLSSAGSDAFTNTRTFSFNWSHSMDSKARPGTTFSANVNVASTKFAASQLNNPTAAYNNLLSSSINYSHTFDQKYNLSVGATHNQNDETGQINVSLPNLAFTAPTIYPLQAKNFVGTPKWYEKLGIGLSTTIQGNMSFYDSVFQFKKLDSLFQWGAQNSIPISLALPLKGPVQVTPGVSLQERVYSRRLYQHYDEAFNKVDTDAIQRGVFQEQTMSFSLSLATAIFGTFQGFGRNSSLMGIRHVIRPTVSLSYTPDFAGKDWYTIRTKYNPSDPLKTTGKQRVSYYDGTTYGPFSEGTFGGISFGLDNHFEIKTRSKTDTSSAGIKKIPIIDGLGINGSYNYLADSMKLSNLTMYFRSTLFKNLNITGGATLDPYQHNNLINQDFNRYAWEGKKFSLGRITAGNLAVSTSFKSAPIDQKLADEKAALQNSDQIPLTMEEEQAQLNYIRQNPAQFADFNIRWSLNLQFALNFTTQEQPDHSFNTLVTSALQFSGDFNLTEKWKIGLNGSYDVKASQMESLQASISRDLHCWQMSINVTPIGYTHFFSITINPKSTILQDLKVNRTKYFYNE